MSSLEFGYWMAYEKMNPGFPERADILAAQICSTIANASPNKRRWKIYKIIDFILDFTPKERPKTWQILKARLGQALKSKGMSFDKKADEE